MNREEALAQFAAFTPRKRNSFGRNAVILGQEILEQITAADLPIDVKVEVGAWREVIQDALWGEGNPDFSGKAFGTVV
jgi:hypothetical protein